MKRRAISLAIGAALAISAIGPAAFAAPHSRLAMTASTGSVHTFATGDDYTKKGLAFKKILNDPDSTRDEKLDVVRYIRHCSQQANCSAKQAALIAWYQRKYDGPGGYRG